MSAHSDLMATAKAELANAKSGLYATANNIVRSTELQLSALQGQEEPIATGSIIGIYVGGGPVGPLGVKLSKSLSHGVVYDVVMLFYPSTTEAANAGRQWAAGKETDK